LIVLSRKSQARVRLRNTDRLLFVWLYRLYPSILDALTIVKPKTVIRWHRRGFRAYWRWKSSRRGGRPRINRDIRDLIRQMNRENPLWGFWLLAGGARGGLTPRRINEDIIW
jgi:hypothetical protein